MNISTTFRDRRCYLMCAVVDSVNAYNTAFRKFSTSFDNQTISWCDEQVVSTAVTQVISRDCCFWHPAWQINTSWVQPIASVEPLCTVPVQLHVCCNTLCCVRVCNKGRPMKHRFEGTRRINLLRASFIRFPICSVMAPRVKWHLEIRLQRCHRIKKSFCYNQVFVQDAKKFLFMMWRCSAAGAVTSVYSVF